MTKNNSIAKQENNQVATIKLEFSEETIELIKSTIAVDATDNELQLFLYQARRTGLDPLARQIYFVKRGGKVVIQTSIDGFRVVAERQGDYAGQDEPEFTEKQGVNHPAIAKVRVYKFKGEQRYLAATGVAYWEEYVPMRGQDFMWQKMPHTMLAKVAEALALRKAFPQDLSGVYTDEEMAQADAQPAQREVVTKITPNGAVSAPVSSNLATEAQKKKIYALCKELDRDPAEITETLKTHYKLESFNDLKKDQASAAIEKLTKLMDEKNSPEVIDGEQIAQDAVDAGL